MLTIGPRSGWLLLAIALAVLALLVQTGHDWLLRVALWAGIVAASTVGLPTGLRRWLLGEPRRPQP